MTSPMSLYSGSSSRRVVQTTKQRSTAPMKQLLRRLQYRLRRSATPPVRFSYDLESYSQNFDDGLGSSCLRRN
jgi:hypothetical protein